MTMSRAQYGAECQRGADHQDDVSKVHGVPDEPVPARRLQLLARLDLHIGCGVTVLDRHQHRDGEADPDEDEPYHRNSCGHRRPAEAMVQRADRDHRRHRPERDDTDQLLQGPCLGTGARLHAAAQRIGILHREIRTRDQCRGGEHGDERPTLPVVERACGPEHQQAEHDETDQRRDCSLDNRFHRHHTPGTSRYWTFSVYSS